MRVLLDSSIIIDHLRTFGQNKETKLISIYRQNEIYFSLITVGEIFSGKSSNKMEKEINEIFAVGRILEPDFELMKEAGRIRKKTHISLLDAIIAAAALKLDLPVATLNTWDFAKVVGLKLYK